MGETLTVEIDSSNDTVQPSLEELAAKLDAENGTTDEGVNAERPAGLPDKFKSVDDLIKSYEELEKKLSSGSKEQTTTDEKPAEEEVSTTDTGESDGEEDAAKEAAEKAGLNFEELSAKFWENGDLESSDYEALEKAGIPKAIVDQYIEGQKALFESTTKAVYNSVGGVDNYTALVDWAAENYSEAEIEAFNQAVTSGNLKVAQVAVKGLEARYQAENGFEPFRVVTPDGNGKVTADVYESVAQMQADMANPLYRTDPAFRQKVEQKLARSSIL